MKKHRLLSRSKKQLADTVTPVNIYLNLRDRFANTILLESSDYHGNENSYSYICCDPIARFQLEGKKLLLDYPDGTRANKTLAKPKDAVAELNQFLESFEVEKNDFPFISHGLFGYMAYDAVRFFEDIEIPQQETNAIPDILYTVYRFILVVNHFNNELFLIENRPEGSPSTLDNVQDYIKGTPGQAFRFQTQNEEVSNFEDAEFLEILNKAKAHCKRGDVFQMVLSRRYSQNFQGDEFNVYRALRSINPSPYLFYFDYGSFKLFGSSPEAQIVVQNNKASIHPIAGTFRRTGDDQADADLARKLSKDPKETAEHLMLVDLARNDLSRHGQNVNVETLKEIQFYSHVIHLVSKVTGELNGISPLQLVADTFPAGTLSGAPKYRAMELIRDYENQNRGFYGGCIGYLGFNGNFNHAIMIRSFLSQHKQLHYQAGAGVVFKSVAQSELEEVHHKLNALRSALKLAQTL